MAMLAVPAVWGGHQATCLGTPLLCVEDEDGVQGPQMKDVWSFTGAPGTTFEVKIDTVDFATAFDPWSRVCTGYSGGVLQGCFAFGDDDFACAHPPPQYACPRVSGTLPPNPTATYYVLAASYFLGGSFRTPGNGEYSIELIATGGLLTLVDDNAPGNP